MENFEILIMDYIKYEMETKHTKELLEDIYKEIGRQSMTSFVAACLYITQKIMASKTIMDKTWNEKRLQYLGGLLDVQDLTDRQSELDTEICSYYIQVRELNRQIDKIRELVTQTIKETMKGEE